jgi:hypothetical protein
MNNKDLLATLVKALSDAEANEKPKTRRSPKRNLMKAPPKQGRNTGRAQGLIGLTCMVPKRVYKLVVEHCREEEITLSSYIRSLLDHALGTDMTGVNEKRFRTPARFPERRKTYRSEPKADPAPPPPPAKKPRPPAKYGPKPTHTDEEIAEYIELFHKENPKASAEQIFGHLRKEYKMRFSHNRAMGMLKKIRAQMLNGKSENIG